MKYALIGLGFISPRHKKAIEKTGGTIVLTCDNDPNKKADFTDYKEMFESPRFLEVDTVVICLPNYLHSEVARLAISKGKPVICEKPLTIFGDYEGLEEVNVVMQLRLNPKIKRWKGKYSNVDLYVKTYREPKYWESWKGQPALSGGILYNMGVHYIDLLIHLLGDPVEIKKSVYSDKLAYGEIYFKNGKGNYYIELCDEWCPTLRKIILNGISVDLEGATIPLKDKGEVIDLHTDVYKEILKGKGFKLKEAIKSLELIEKLKNGAQIL